MKFLTEADLRAKYSEEVQDLKRKLKEKDRQIRSYRKEHGSIVNLFNIIKDAIESLKPLKVKYKAPSKKTRVETPCPACFLICDTHYGAVQNKSEIEGFGEYSPEICERRSIEYIKRGIEWVELHRSNYTINNAHVLVAGDLISGDIHRELSVTNAFPVPVQVVGSARLLANQIAKLAPHFGKVKVEFISEDNHGRLTKKPQAKEAGLNSFNYLVGEIAKLMLKKFANVEFNIYPQYEAVINIEGRRYLMMHGHNVRGWMGLPFYGIERKMAREAVKRMNAPDINKFHKVIMGHWHAPLTHPVYWIGGSTQGTDAYDHKSGRYADPSQAAWLIHKKYGEFDRTDFILK